MTGLLVPDTDGTAPGRIRIRRPLVTSLGDIRASSMQDDLDTGRYRAAGEANRRLCGASAGMAAGTAAPTCQLQGSHPSPQIGLEVRRLLCVGTNLERLSSQPRREKGC